MLVAAMEAAVQHSRRPRRGDSAKLERDMPDVAQALRRHGREGVLGGVADAVYRPVRKAFWQFGLEFLPGPPDDRPPVSLQVPWDREGLERALKTVYDHRSAALHSGTPFPFPMCDPPQKHGHGLAEKPAGRGWAGKGGAWRERDLPMLLHAFEWLARGCLLKWWESMAGNKGHDADGSVGEAVEPRSECSA
jgi:hypothetical protein